MDELLGVRNDDRSDDIHRIQRRHDHHIYSTSFLFSQLYQSQHICRKLMGRLGRIAEGETTTKPLGRIIISVSIMVVIKCRSANS